MFIQLKVTSGDDLPPEDRISEVLINTDNINYLMSAPGMGVVVCFNSPTFVSGEPSNMLIVKHSLQELLSILKEKGLM